MGRRSFTADFETTTDVNDCRVWAWSISEIGNSDYFEYGINIDEFMLLLEKRNNADYYFHNLKFDGEYIVNWLLKNGFTWVESSDQRASNTFTTLISDMGAWYSIEIYFFVGKKVVNKATIKDSLKILNFSVDEIAKRFNTGLSKLDLDYTSYRVKGHQLTQHEIEYIKNDVQIMAKALSYMFDLGHKKITIASDAMADYKNRQPYFNSYFPVLEKEIDYDIRESYKGGFTYLNPLYAEKTTGRGIVFDVNSMYPAKMKYEAMPVGFPEPFDGKYEKDRLYPLYVQKLTCNFRIKKGKIPSIQLKNNIMYRVNEYVEESKDITALCLTKPDLELFFDQYDVWDLQYQGGWKFQSETGIFDDYIDYWSNEKIKAKADGNPALYQISKLFLNSLYGKFGLNSNSRAKQPYLDDGIVKYAFYNGKERKTIYCPVASFITSYARSFIIRSSQIIRDYSLVKYGEDRYVYSDTDSIHCLLSTEDVVELSKIMEIDDYKLGAWKLESEFKRGKYLRQKCYIEEDLNGEIQTTIAGLPKRMKSYITFSNFNYGFTTAKMTEEERRRFGEKLQYKHVDGGVVLVPTDFTII